MPNRWAQKKMAMQRESARLWLFMSLVARYPIALLPSSPVLILTHLGNSRTNIFPSPICSVRAPLTIAASRGCLKWGLGSKNCPT